MYSAVAHLCYGKHNAVDLLELCGGAARISKVAFKRELVSGGNLDLATKCDLGDPRVQKAVNHYLETCHVLVTVLQPNCRTTGRNSYHNSLMYPESWSRHHQEDLPRIQYCGKVALKQMGLKRFFIGEQPVGTWIDDIEPWPKVSVSVSYRSEHGPVYGRCCGWRWLASHDTNSMASQRSSVNIAHAEVQVQSATPTLQPHRQGLGEAQGLPL